MQVLIYCDNHQVFSKTIQMLKAWCTVCECELHQTLACLLHMLGWERRNRPEQMARRLKEEQQGLGMRMNEFYWG